MGIFSWLFGKSRRKLPKGVYVDDLRKTLGSLDCLLEELPEDRIREFIKTEEYVRYKKIMHILLPQSAASDDTSKDDISKNAVTGGTGAVKYAGSGPMQNAQPAAQQVIYSDSASVQAVSDAQPVSNVQLESNAQPVSDVKPLSSTSADVVGGPILPSAVPHSQQVIQQQAPQPATQPMPQAFSQQAPQPATLQEMPPANQPTTSHSSQPTHQPFAQSVATPEPHSAAPPAVPSTAAPAAQPIAHSAAPPASQPIAHSAASPASQPTAAPAAQPIAQSAASPASQPTAAPAAQPIAQSAASPASQPTAAPAAQPIAQSAASPDPQHESQSPQMGPKASKVPASGQPLQMAAGAQAPQAASESGVLDLDEIRARINRKVSERMDQPSIVAAIPQKETSVQDVPSAAEIAKPQQSQQSPQTLRSSQTPQSPQHPQSPQTAPAEPLQDDADVGIPNMALIKAMVEEKLRGHGR